MIIFSIEEENHAIEKKNLDDASGMAKTMTSDIVSEHKMISGGGHNIAVSYDRHSRRCFETLETR